MGMLNVVKSIKVDRVYFRRLMFLFYKALRSIDIWKYPENFMTFRFQNL